MYCIDIFQTVDNLYINSAPLEILVEQSRQQIISYLNAVLAIALGESSISCLSSIENSQFQRQTFEPTGTMRTETATGTGTFGPTQTNTFTGYGLGLSGTFGPTGTFDLRGKKTFTPTS